MRSRGQREWERERTGSLSRPQQCVRPPSRVIKWPIGVASRILDRASNQSHLCRTRIVSATTSGESPNPVSQICRDGQIRRIDDRACVRERLIARQFVIFTTQSTGRCRARCSQVL